MNKPVPVDKPSGHKSFGLKPTGLAIKIIINRGQSSLLGLPPRRESYAS